MDEESICTGEQEYNLNSGRERGYVWGQRHRGEFISERMVKIVHSTY